jgi:ABC-type lipoprotein export system ATPase subunit
MKTLLEFRQVHKRYDTASGTRDVLRSLSLIVPQGQILAISGRSGSGKSTLLHLAAALEVPTSGEIWFDGQSVSAWGDTERTLFRRDQIGFVFQFFHLLPHLNVLDNVLLPAFIAGNARSMHERARGLLTRVDLGDRAHDEVERLSGGEMQRIAICRALLRRPTLLLADEPTGNLDRKSGADVMACMSDLVHEEGSTLIYVTHSREIASRADVVRHLVDGRWDET